MLQTFLPLFFMTFGICLFIVLMQFLWRYIDDMVGKGLGIPVLAEMFFYAALVMVPMALPLAILLASLMTFGNLGERLELLAMKSAGVSLLNIMKPLIVTIGMISVGAFYYQNYIMPIAQVKMYTLLWSMRQKSPELDIPEGVFCSDIPGYNVYVRHKDKTGLLKDLMIYDLSKGFNNASVIVADSGRLKTSEDKMFLILSLFNGESFSNFSDQNATNATVTSVPYRRETFQTQDILMDFDANFERTDESFMQGMFMAKNMKDLQHSIDSMTTFLDSVKNVNATAMYETSYKRGLSKPNKEEKVLGETQPKKTKDIIVVNYDSIYSNSSLETQASLVNRARSRIESMKADYFFKAATLGDESAKVRRHLTEWHRKFTVSAACLIFFFIGAPLGAIIRKGGLGLPVVISVLLFIFYYIIENMGFKMARDGIWPAWEGMWLSSAVLAPLGIFLTYKAVNDSVILNADTYMNAIKNFIGKKTARKVERKEVLIYTPDYEGILPRLELLSKNAKDYQQKQKRWQNYISFWKEGGKDHAAENLSAEMECLIEELSNSDQTLVLNKLMDYPIINGYNQINNRISGATGIAMAIILPIGLPLYFIATYQRKLLITDVKTIEKTSNELIDIISKNTN